MGIKKNKQPRPPQERHRSAIETDWFMSAFGQMLGGCDPTLSASSQIFVTPTLNPTIPDHDFSEFGCSACGHA